MTQRIEKTSDDALSGSFGFDPRQSVAHFLVHVPTSAQHPVEISEHLSWNETRISVSQHYGTTNTDGQVRVRLARSKWNEIADTVRAEFNARLKRQGYRPGRWKTGFNPIVRIMGKELVLLAWAIEDADPSLVRTAIANWQGLSPEERWWLYTMTAAASGHAQSGRGVGWRKAVRFALTENPVMSRATDQAIVPEFYRLAVAAEGTLFARDSTAPQAAESSDVPLAEAAPGETAPVEVAQGEAPALPQFETIAQPVKTRRRARKTA